MFQRLFSFQSPILRGVASLWILFHFVVLFSAWIAQRGTSYLLDELLTQVAPYTAVGNWRADLTPLTIAGATPLGEELKIEFHRAEAEESTWEMLSSVHGRAKSTEAGRQVNSAAAQRWLLQLNGLLYFNNEELVGRMMTSALRAESTQRDLSIDGLRITASARPDQDEYEQLKNQTPSTEVRNRLQSHVVYAATVVDLGDGQISLLPKLEQHRASKSLVPSSEVEPGAKP